MAMTNYIRENKTFLNNVYAKVRCEGFMRRLPVMVVKPEIKLSILGLKRRVTDSLAATSRKCDVI